MARTPSNMVPLGTPAPAFSLPDTVSGRTVALRDFARSDALLVMFICNHCPYVKHVRAELARLGRDYGVGGSASRGRSVGIVAISSNDAAAYPDDAPDKMAAEAREAGYTFPYLYDESQKVARAYGAACTPDFFLFDGTMKLAYRGQLDDSRPKVETPLPVTGKDLRAALDAVLRGQSPSANQVASLGCNIKWKPGNEPQG
jgi:peroxiredoxin